MLQCNKENYGQCFTQGNLKQMILSLIEAYNGDHLSGTSGDRDSDDGRPLSLANSRRPSISAPISRKSSLSRVHSPPLASPGSHLLEDGSTSTPKRLSEGLYRAKPVPLTSTANLLLSPDNDKRPDSVTLSLDHKENELDNKHRDSIEIKQERLNDASLCPDDDFHSLSTTQPPLKKLRADVADAESNTTNSGKSSLFFCCKHPLTRKRVKGRKAKIDTLQE